MLSHVSKMQDFFHNKFVQHYFLLPIPTMPSQPNKTIKHYLIERVLINFNILIIWKNNLKMFFQSLSRIKIN